MPPKTILYAYPRKAQSVEDQIYRLEQDGPHDAIYQDVVTPKTIRANKTREWFGEMLKFVQADDTVKVTNIGTLARNEAEFLTVYDFFQVRRVRLVILDEPRLDTGADGHALANALIVAIRRAKETKGMWRERDIDALHAKKRASGKLGGRSPKLVESDDPEAFAKARADWFDRTIKSSVEATARHGVSESKMRATFGPRGT